MSDIYSFAACLLITGSALAIFLPEITLADQESGLPPHRLSAEIAATPTVPTLDDAQTEAGSQGMKVPNEKPQAAIGTLVYIPPRRGAPVGRVGAGARGTEGKLPLLSALAPEHVGLTVHEQPSLYWYLAEQLSSPIEFTLINDQAIPPLVEVSLPPPFKPGVQRVQLADYDIYLLPGLDYQWSVALIQDPDSRSKDILASGFLERIHPPEDLRGKLFRTSGLALPYLFAEAGLWYDALMAISDLIDASPNDRALRKQRAFLFEQVGLSEIAKYDR